MKKLNFKCCNCVEKFNIDTNNLLNRNNLICPNCSNTLPSDVFDKLKQLIVLINEIEQNAVKIEEDGSVNTNANHFEFHFV